MKHALRVKKYLRYGDDFVIFTNNRDEAVEHRKLMRAFLYDKLSLTLHARNDVIFHCSHGLKFLGCMLHPTHRFLQKRVWSRVLERTTGRNIGSYSGLVHAHCDTEKVKYFHWSTLKFLDERHHHCRRKVLPPCASAVGVFLGGA